MGNVFSGRWIFLAGDISRLAQLFLALLVERLVSLVERCLYMSVLGFVDA